MLLSAGDIYMNAQQHLPFTTTAVTLTLTINSRFTYLLTYLTTLTIKLHLNIRKHERMNVFVGESFES